MESTKSDDSEDSPPSGSRLAMYKRSSQYQASTLASKLNPNAPSFVPKLPFKQQLEKILNDEIEQFPKDQTESSNQNQENLNSAVVDLFLRLAVSVHNNSGLVLRNLMRNHREVSQLEWKCASEYLKSVGCLSSEGKLTSLGLACWDLPLSVDLALFVIVGSLFRASRSCAAIAALWHTNNGSGGIGNLQPFETNTKELEKGASDARNSWIKFFEDDNLESSIPSVLRQMAYYTKSEANYKARCNEAFLDSEIMSKAGSLMDHVVRICHESLPGMNVHRHDGNIGVVLLAHAITTNKTLDCNFDNNIEIRFDKRAEPSETGHVSSKSVISYHSFNKKHDRLMLNGVTMLPSAITHLGFGLLEEINSKSFGIKNLNLCFDELTITVDSKSSFDTFRKCIKNVLANMTSTSAISQKQAHRDFDSLLHILSSSHRDVFFVMDEYKIVTSPSCTSARFCTNCWFIGHSTLDCTVSKLEAEERQILVKQYKKGSAQHNNNCKICHSPLHTEYKCTRKVRCIRCSNRMNKKTGNHIFDYTMCKHFICCDFCNLHLHYTTCCDEDRLALAMEGLTAAQFYYQIWQTRKDVNWKHRYEQLKPNSPVCDKIMHPQPSDTALSFPIRGKPEKRHHVILNRNPSSLSYFN